MVSAPDTLVGEMTIIRAMSGHDKELWMFVSLVCSLTVHCVADDELAHPQRI